MHRLPWSPPLSHHKRPDACIFLLQLGGPATRADIEPFLRNLFEDVLPVPLGMRWMRRWVAAWMAKRRAPRIAPLYEAMGQALEQATEGGSPLLANTQAQQRALQARLADAGLHAEIFITMRYAPPRAAEAVHLARRWCADIPWVALPLYPHYSFATTRSSLQELQSLLTPPELQRLQVVEAYPTDARYLDASAACLEETLCKLPSLRSAHVLFSAHGLPLTLIRQGDPYPEHIQATVEGIMARLQKPVPYSLAYQSRVGPSRWLTPSTAEALQKLGHAGVQDVVVVPISFVSEHIETLYELDRELREVASQAGMTGYHRVPTLADRPDFINALAHKVLQALNTAPSVQLS